MNGAARPAGRMIAVVGPSGVGKDSVMAGLLEARPALRRVRRVITRAPGLAGEDYDAVTPERFAALAGEGAFCLHWAAHGLRYGVPVPYLEAARAGQSCLVNLSRGVLASAAEVFPSLIVLNITARPETVEQRLRGRGRESRADIARRLARARVTLPDGLSLHHIANDGALEEAVAAASAVLDQCDPVRA